jgi:hypothetical protein
LKCIYKLTVSKKVVIPVKALHHMVFRAKAGIQYLQDLLDAPVLSTGEAPQVRHDGIADLINEH